MATVVLQPAFARRYTGGVCSIAVPARDYQSLIAWLETRYPGFEKAVAQQVAVAIDGQIYPDPLTEQIGPESEVFFLPALEGG